MQVLQALLLLCTLCINHVENVRTFKDPDLLSRIPRKLRRDVDEMISGKLNQILSVHFDNNEELTYGTKVTPITEGLTLLNELHNETDIDRKRDEVLSNDEQQIHSRRKRDINDTSPIYGQWTEFSDCSVKCGGGIRVKTRDCLQGNCTILGSYIESLECGILPCISGTYNLDGMSPVWHVSLTGAKAIRFFTIHGRVFLGYITEDMMYVYLYNTFTIQFDLHQSWAVTEGISFTLLDTKSRIYMVVIEKSINSFPGRFSRMYFYDPFRWQFDTAQPVQFDVFDPSAAITFDIYGQPFMAIVNRKNKVMSPFGARQQLIICDSETRTLTCPTGTYISISEVFYGRVSQWECSSGQDFSLAFGRYFSYCIINGVKQIVVSQCENQQSCTLTASPNSLIRTFDTCVQTKKYLRVLYTCSTMSFMGQPYFYRWDGIGLSVVPSDNLVTFGAEDIEAFNIHHKAYVVVANYINDQGSHHLDSEIYFYNLEERKFQSMQKLRTDGAIDMEFFVIGNGIAREYFLAVANHVKIYPNGQKTYEIDSVIYKWNWNLFVPFQCIRTYGALKWTAVTGSGGQFVLSITNRYGNMTFYEYDGWRFFETKIQPEGDIFEEASGSYYTTVSNQQFLMVRNKKSEFNETKNIYLLDFIKTFPKYDLIETTMKAVEEMNQTVYNLVLPRAKLFNIAYEESKDDIIFITDFINMTGLNDLSFKDVEVIDNTTVITAVTSIVNMSISDIRHFQRQMIINDTLAIQKETIRNTEEYLSRAVTTLTAQNITSSKTFTADLHVDNLTVDTDIYVSGTVNNVNLSALNENALFIDEDENVSGSFTFDEIVFVSASISVDGKINNVSLEDAVTVNTEQIITSKMIFENIRFAENQAGNIGVKGMVNGLNTSDFVLLDNAQTITADHVFLGKATIKNDLLVDGLVNSMNISEIALDTLMKDRVGLVTAPKTFSKLQINGNLIMADEMTINDVDVSELKKNGIYLNYDDVFNDTLIFAGNVTFQHVLLGLTLNQQNLSNLLFTDQPEIISTPITFNANVTCYDSITVDGLVNDVDIPANVLDTYSNQTITGHFTFHDKLFVNENLVVHGLVDSVNITKLYSNSMLMNKAQTVTGFKHIDTVHASHVTLLDCTNDCPLLEVFNNLTFNTARESNTTVIINGTKKFLNGLEITGNVNASTINNKAFPGDLLIQFANQTITGDKTFLNNVSFYSNVTLSLINHFNLSDIYERALRTVGNQTITGRWIFAENVTFTNNVNVLGTVDDIDLSQDVAYTDRDNIIDSRKTFLNTLDIDELHTYSMNVHGLIDGVNLTELVADLVSLSGDIIIKGKKIFTNHVSFAGNWTILGLIDGVNITELDENAMRLDETQTVIGIKTLKTVHISSPDVQVDGYVDGVNLTELAQNALRITDPTVIFYNDITCDNITVAGNLTVNGYINNINLTAVVEDTLMKDGDQIISGHHDIINVTIHDGLDISGLVNGINFTNEVIVLTNPGTITGYKYFPNGLNADNVNVNGYINDVNITRFNERIAFINEDTYFTGQITFDSDLIINNLNVAGYINGVNWTYLIFTTLMKSGDQNITVPIHFNEITMEEDLKLSGFMNNFNITEFSTKAVYKCNGPNLPITGNHVYESVIVNGDSNISNITVHGTVNGLNLTEMVAESVKTYGEYNITGRKYVKYIISNSIETGAINGFMLPDDFVRLNQPEVVKAKKEFQHDVTVITDVVMATAKTINGVDISELEDNIVSKDGIEVITTSVQFEGLLSINQNLDSNLVNSVNVSEHNILLKSGTQTITGLKNFNHVETNLEVITENHINGFDLKKIENETILSGRDNIISGLKTIEGSITVTGDVNTNLVDGANVSTLFNGFTRISNLYRDLTKFNRSIELHTEIISEVTLSIGDIHQSLDYFVDYEEVPLNYKSISLDVFSNKDATWLVAGALSDMNGQSCTNTTIYKKGTGSNDTFSQHSQIVSSSITGTKFVETTNGFYYFTSSNRVSGGCYVGLDNQKQYSVSYLFNNVTDIFERKYSTETKKATNVDVETDVDDLNTVYTNTYDSVEVSSCVYQSIHVVSGSKEFTYSASNKSCNVIKTIVLESTSNYTFVGILASSVDSIKQVDVYGVDLKKQGNNADRFSWIQSIQTFDASDIFSFSSKLGKFLLIANTYDSSPSSLKVSYTVPVIVFRLNIEVGKMENYQEIQVYGAEMVKHFVIGSYDYIAIATFDQRVVILKHKGVSKWQMELTVPTRGFNAVKDFTFWMDLNYDLYMAILSEDPWDKTYPSKVNIAKAEFTSAAEGQSIVKKLQDN